jgi:hypothetical protein
MNIQDSPHFKFANQELDWFPMDSKIRYDHNLKHNFDKLAEYGWVDSKFTYKFNSQGFRCDEFTEEPSVVFLGCSITQGIGLPLKNTWSYIVSQNLKLQCFNLGIGGGSNDTAFRLAFTRLNQIKPKLVVLCSPFPERLELLSPSEQIQLLANTPTQLPGMDYYNIWISNNDNSILNTAKNTLAIERLCAASSFKFVNVNITQIKFLDYARDLMHPGIQSNQAFAEFVLTLV